MWRLPLSTSKPSTVPRFKLLVAMSRGGDYADVVWEFADVISGTRATTAAGGKLSAYRTRIGGISVTVPTGVGDYRSALGCDMPASK